MLDRMSISKTTKCVGFDLIQLIFMIWFVHGVLMFWRENLHWWLHVKMAINFIYPLQCCWLPLEQRLLMCIFMIHIYNILCDVMWLSGWWDSSGNVGKRNRQNHVARSNGWIQPQFHSKITPLLSSPRMWRKDCCCCCCCCWGLGGWSQLGSLVVSGKMKVNVNEYVCEVALFVKVSAMIGNGSIFSRWSSCFLLFLRHYHSVFISVLIIWSNDFTIWNQFCSGFTFTSWSLDEISGISVNKF